MQVRIPIHIPIHLIKKKKETTKVLNTFFSVQNKDTEDLI